MNILSTIKTELQSHGEMVVCSKMVLSQRDMQVDKMKSDPSLKLTQHTGGW